MPSARYWRIYQPTPYNTDGILELTEVGLYSGGSRVDWSATVTSSVAPSTGSLAALKDGVTSSTVAFSRAAWSAKGFWIAYDLGSSSNVDDIRVSSSNDEATSIFEFVLQSSSDGTNWDNELFAQRIPYTSPPASVIVPIANADQYDAQTILRLKGSGAEGSTTFTDQSVAGKSLTVIGNIKNTYADKFMRGPSIYVDGANDGLRIGADTDFNFGTGDYTIELWHKPLSYTNGFAAFMASGRTTWASGSRLFRMHDGAVVGVPKSIAYVAYEVIPAYQSYSSGCVELSRWTHFALSKQGSFRYLFVDGILVSTHTSSSHVDNFNDGGFTYLLYSDIDKQSLHGYVDEVCVTKGVARYTVSDSTIPLRAAYRGRYYSGSRTRPLFGRPSRDIALFTNPTVDTSVKTQVHPLPAIDMVFGGNGVINGTVKEKNLPVNTPLARRVRLVEQRSGYLVAETMSDGATGAYSFANIDRSRKYTVLSYDHTGIYRAVIADNLTPELMT